MAVKEPIGVPRNLNAADFHWNWKPILTGAAVQLTLYYNDGQRVYAVVEQFSEKYLMTAPSYILNHHIQLVVDRLFHAIDNGHATYNTTEVH